MRNTIDFGDFSFSDNAILSIEVVSEESLNMRTLAVDTLEAVVICNNPEITLFSQNEPIYIKRNGTLVGTFFTDSVTRNGKNSYLIKGVSSLGRLMQTTHYGGVYEAKKAGELIDEICGDIPHIVGSVFLNAEVYGWLPIAEARSNLAQVLFAIGANLKTDRDGTLRIDNLKTTVSSVIDEDAMYADGAAVEYAAPITDVVVVQHVFSAPAYGEERTLFEGTSTERQVIVFNEPIVIDTIAGTGIPIEEAHENYAVIGSGSGSVVGVPYTHTTAEVRVPVSTAASMQNVERIEDAFLVSIFNAGTVAERLADYYKQRTRINASIVRQFEAPGDVISIIDPFELIPKSACIERSSILFSSVAKASISSILGFVPHQEKQYIDVFEKLTGSGSWTAPTGATSVTAVLISGGDGGAAGKMGGAPGAATIKTFRTSVEISPTNSFPTGGAGGAAGAGGAGGAVFRVVLAVLPGESISFSCGAGGVGAAYGEEVDDRQRGGDTFFGESSTRGIERGTTFYEPSTGKQYALSGETGIRGMDGSGSKDTSFSDTDYYIPDPIRVGSEAWYCGNRYNPPRGGAAYKAIHIAGYGGGAAYGNNGGDSAAGSWNNDYNGIRRVNAGRGGDGANAMAPLAAIDGFGYGGAGGNGGGGAGSTGAAVGYEGTGITRVEVIANSIAHGGNGSAGGDGGAGCILLYYRIPAEQGGNAT